MWVEHFDNITNVETLGQVIYTHYLAFFLIAGIILLVALLGAVSLTIKEKSTVKSQEIYKQLSRQSQNAIFICKEKM